MMLQKKENPYVWLKYTYVLQLVAICMIAFSCCEVSSKFKKISNTKVSDAPIKDTSVSDAPIKDTSVSDAPIKDTSVSDAPIKDTSVSDAPVDAPIKDTSVSDAPVDAPIKDTSVSDAPVEDTIDDVVARPEKFPEFPGGFSKLSEYTSQNSIYPEKARAKGIEGRVMVQFIIEKDGSIGYPKVVVGIDPDLDAEALRVVSSMPKWTPGKDNGKNVRVELTIGVSFTLPEDEESQN